MKNTILLSDHKETVWQFSNGKSDSELSVLLMMCDRLRHLLRVQFNISAQIYQLASFSKVTKEVSDIKADINGKYWKHVYEPLSNSKACNALLL